MNQTKKKHLNKSKKGSTNLPKNRDLNRVNKGALLIEGSIFSLINKDGISAIKEMTSSLSNQIENNIIPNNLKHNLDNISKLAEKCQEANELTTHNMMKCATHIKTGAKRIATSENRLIKISIKNDEMSTLKSTMMNYNPKMIDMQTYIQNIRLSCSNHLDTNDMSTEASSQQTISQQQSPVQTDNQILPSMLSDNHRNYPSFTIPLPVPPRTRFTPFQMITIIKTQADGKKRLILDLPKINNQYQIKNVGRYLVIKILIAKKLVPRTKTQIYEILKNYQEVPH